MAIDRLTMLAHLAIAWDAHPDWTLGRIVASAASICTGELRTNPRNQTDEAMASALRALIPDPEEGRKPPKELVEV